MNKTINSFLFLLFLLTSLSGVSQSSDTILLTVEKDDISVEEFLRVYKKNLDLVQDESQKSIDGYLDLFINYQLKLQEAKQLGLDKSPTYLKDYEKYKEQLINSYVKEHEVTSQLVKEAYNRMKYDVNAVHILVKSSATGQDTLAIYNQLLDYRKQLDDEGFEATKAKLHNGQTIFVEDLGYFSSFKMVYDFESAAYNTPVGTISMPFKTSFGYHVVKVLDKKPSRGTVTAAHIMVLHKQKDSTVNAESRIKDIYAKIEAGESFEALAKQFSDDKGSARNGGKLSPFKSGQLNSTVFEDTAFGLANVGDISKPIQTQNGWHIVKLLNKKQVPEFEDAKPGLEAQIKRDSRSKLINSAMASKLMERYTVNLNPNAQTYLSTIINDDFFSGKFVLPETFKGEDYVLKINDSVYSNSDFIKHLQGARRKYMRKQVPTKQMLSDELTLFKENSLLDYRKKNLEFEDKEFASILKEYRDGLLLFDLMEKEIWNKASKDTLGLKAFYEANASNYTYKDRVKVQMASTKDKALAERIHSFRAQGKSKEEIKTLLDASGKAVLFTNGVFARDDTKFPQDLQFNLGLSPIYKHNENYHSLNVLEVLPSGIKPFNETKGAVINDYQTQLEANWIDALKEKYKVKVNEEALEALKKRLNQ
ncbi:peptidylprolyl isomerase [Winogradskyella maritima]|uniref:Peptidylprolyl isomerase n=1 Tax=Winogradskyella maritima TaxID=1517766 RepID=A0ABV8AMB2_9FLAO|nr:peptidylprolyl isomerase [Winogradskyella maritima]